jgi:hypothetical protein
MSTMTSEPAGKEPSRAKVFISYARKDLLLLIALMPRSSNLTR